MLCYTTWKSILDALYNWLHNINMIVHIYAFASEKKRII